jgi:uncharacterized Fe-S cluster-containing MiaB family protein
LFFLSIHERVWTTALYRAPRMFAASDLLNHLIDRADAEPVCHPAFYELQENSNLWDRVRRGIL